MQIKSLVSRNLERNALCGYKLNFTVDLFYDLTDDEVV